MEEEMFTDDFFIGLHNIERKPDGENQEEKKEVKK